MDARGRPAGFTLVELVITLVIIGLLIGAVLKGQEMTTNARVSRIESEFRRVTAAILAYQNRYGVLPGDDPAASTRFPGVWTSADDGNGNGAIEGAWDSTDDLDESRKIWKHLRGAGLIEGPSNDSSASYQQPKHALGGPLGFQLDIYNLNGHAIVFGAVPGSIDQALDAHGDDGSPLAGAIQGSATQSAWNISASYDVALRF